MKIVDQNKFLPHKSVMNCFVPLENLIKRQRMALRLLVAVWPCGWFYMNKGEDHISLFPCNARFMWARIVKKGHGVLRYCIYKDYSLMMWYIVSEYNNVKGFRVRHNAAIDCSLLLLFHYII